MVHKLQLIHCIDEEALHLIVPHYIIVLFLVSWDFGSFSIFRNVPMHTPSCGGALPSLSCHLSRTLRSPSRVPSIAVSLSFVTLPRFPCVLQASNCVTYKHTTGNVVVPPRPLPWCNWCVTGRSSATASLGPGEKGGVSACDRSTPSSVSNRRRRRALAQSWSRQRSRFETPLQVKRRGKTFRDDHRAVLPGFLQHCRILGAFADEGERRASRTLNKETDWKECWAMQLAAFYFRNVKRTIDSKIVHKISAAFSDDSAFTDKELDECYETLMLHRDNIVRFLPLWCKLPYFQRLAWANTTLTSMWSQIKSYAEKTAVATIMGDKDNVGYLEYYLPGMKDKIKIESIDFGKNPLRVLSVNVFNTPDEELMIALQLSWASRMKMVFAYPLKVLGYSMSLKLHFSELQFSTTLRVWGSPLVDRMPCIGKASLSLGEVPDLDFSLRFALNDRLSGDLMAVPGLHWLFKYFTTRVLQQSIVWPSQYVTELMENGGRSPPPVGVLTVNLIKATGVKDKDWSGLDLDDIYAVMNIRSNEKVTSTVKKNNSDPIWNEKFTLLLTDADKDCLTIQLYDYDKLLTDTQLCHATLPLNLLSEETLQEFELQLYKQDVRGQEHKKEAAAHLQEEESLSDIQIQDRVGVNDEHSRPEEATVPAQGQDNNHIAETVVGTNSEEPARTFFQNAEGVYCEHGDNLLPLRGSTVKISVSLSRIRSSTANSSSKMASSLMQTRRNMNMRKSKDAKGLLRVVLLRADELEGFKKIPENIMRPFARLQMGDDIRTSVVKKYTDSPNWNETFDFNNVSPDSKLVVEVFHKWKRKLVNKLVKRQDISLGRVEIPLDDVTRNQSLTNVFKLRSTRSGAVQLQLIWHWY